MKIFGFKGGIHPPDNKIKTEHLVIEKIKAPDLIYVPLLQHIGSPVEPLVVAGDRVLKGQKIADSDAFLCSPIHSPVSGIVQKIDNHVYPLSGKTKTIFIENDNKEEWVELTPLRDVENASRQELLDTIREKGIVGIGGASFPTHVKLDPPKDVTIDVLLINGAECEPYLNSDNRLMIEEPDSIIKGIEIIKKILNVEKAIIGIENNKKEAINSMKKAAEGTNIEVAELKTKYPQGGEKQLIKALLNRVVPSGKLPSAVGVVVQNVGTAAIIFDAISKGLPLIEKVVTISGEAIINAKNLRVSIGTPISYLLEYCGIDREEMGKLVMGGPMMGAAQTSEEVPIIKGTSGLLALTKKEMNIYKPKPCISCGKCVDVCPINLEPLMFERLYTTKEWDELKKYNLTDCIECGSCSYICPTNRQLVEAIKLGKTKIKTLKK